MVKPAQLERLELDDPHAVLLQVPGVYVRQEDGLGLRPNIGLRGANPDRSKKVTLMEDGVLLGPAPYAAPAAYYFPVITRMSALRVVKGPSAVAHGPQTVGGAVDMVTRSIPAAPSGELDLALGMFGYQKTHGYFGASDGQSGFLIEGIRLHSDGFKTLDGGGDTGFTRNEWMVKGSHVLDPAADTLHEFSIKLTYSDEVSNETYLGLTDADFEVDPDRRYLGSALDRMQNHRTALVLTHHYENPSGTLRLTTSAYRHDFERSWRKLNAFRGASVSDVVADPEAPSNAALFAVLSGQADSIGGADTLLIGPNYREFVNQGVQSVLDAELITGPFGHRIEAGARLHHDSILRRHSQTGYLATDGELVPDGMATEVTTANEASSVALALHAIDAVSWHDLTLTPGLRMELIWSDLSDELADTESDATTLALLPGIGAYYRLFGGLGALVGVYRGFSPPPPGDPDSEPEYSINYEAGARYSEGRARVELIGFFNDYGNLTNVCTFSNGCLDADLDSQSSAGSAHIYGFEAYLEYTARVASVRIPVQAAYTLTQAEFRETFSSNDPTFGDVERGDELPYVPVHQLNVGIGAEGERGGIFVAASYVSAMREQAGDEPLSQVTATDALLWFDVGGRLVVVRGVELYAQLRNAFDRRATVSHRPYGARPNAPRWLQVGVKGSF